MRSLVALTALTSLLSTSIAIACGGPRPARNTAPVTKPRPTEILRVEQASLWGDAPKTRSFVLLGETTTPADVKWQRLPVHTFTQPSIAQPNRYFHTVELTVLGSAGAQHITTNEVVWFSERVMLGDKAFEAIEVAGDSGPQIAVRGHFEGRFHAIEAGTHADPTNWLRTHFMTPKEDTTPDVRFIAGTNIEVIYYVPVGSDELRVVVREGDKSLRIFDEQFAGMAELDGAKFFVVGDKLVPLKD